MTQIPNETNMKQIISKLSNSNLVVLSGGHWSMVITFKNLKHFILNAINFERYSPSEH